MVLELSRPILNHIHLLSKASSVKTSLVIALIVTKGMNAAIFNACAYVWYQALFSAPALIDSEYEARSQLATRKYLIYA